MTDGPVENAKNVTTMLTIAVFKTADKRPMAQLADGLR